MSINCHREDSCYHLLTGLGNLDERVSMQTQCKKQIYYLIFSQLKPFPPNLIKCCQIFLRLFSFLFLGFRYIYQSNKPFVQSSLITQPFLAFLILMGDQGQLLEF